jgi:hypothetical protein
MQNISTPKVPMYFFFFAENLTSPHSQVASAISFASSRISYKSNHVMGTLSPLFFLLAALGFELRAPTLLDKCSTI